MTTSPGSRVRKAGATGIALQLALLSLVALVLAGQGLGDEDVVSVNADMSRHLMNGVFIRDLLVDLPLREPFDYALRYYAKYPALTLGHHPILLSLAEAPFYALFGVSVLSARLSILAFLLLGVGAWWLLVRSIYGEPVAFFASLLLVTTPFVANYAQVVMTEIPTLSLVILSAYVLQRYCDSDRPIFALLFLCAVTLSVLSKPLAILMTPVFAIHLVHAKGLGVLRRMEWLLIGGLALAVIGIPLLLTIGGTRHFGWLLQEPLAPRLAWSNLSYYLDVLWSEHLTPGALFLALSGLAASLYRRDRRVCWFLLWIVGYYIPITLLAVREPRYCIYWIPPFCLLAATPLALAKSRHWQLAVTAVLLATSVYQFKAALDLRPDRLEGYRQAAQYVVDNPRGESVLFCGGSRDGYFVFHVRAHDPEGRLVVLRADRLLATRMMGSIIEERVRSPEEIHALLRDFGVGYVVIEETDYASNALATLRAQTHTDAFALRKSIPTRFESQVRRLPPEKFDLAIYEYRQRTPARPDKTLSLNVPLLGRSIEVPFEALMRRRDAAAAP